MKIYFYVPQKDSDAVKMLLKFIQDLIVLEYQIIIIPISEYKNNKEETEVVKYHLNQHPSDFVVAVISGGDGLHFYGIKQAPQLFILREETTSSQLLAAIKKI